MSGRVTTKVAGGAAVSKGRAEADLAVGPARAVRGDVGWGTASAKEILTAAAAMGRRIAAPPSGGTAIAKGRAGAVELVCAATGTVRGGVTGLRDRYGRRHRIAIAVVWLA